MPADQFSSLESTRLSRVSPRTSGRVASPAEGEKVQRAEPGWLEEGGLLDALPYFIGCLALLTALVKMLCELPR